MKKELDTREAILAQIWDSENETFNLTTHYDSLPHIYGMETLYQSEAYIINYIATQPGITVTELSAILHKTPSACSQMVRKLRDKGWVRQIRNEENNRLFNLELTDSGMHIFHSHDAFNQECQSRTYALLDEFDEEQLNCFLKVRKTINEAYRNDISYSQQLLEKAKEKNRS